MPDNDGSDADNPTTVFYSRAYTAAACEFDTTRKAAWIVDSLSRRPIAGIRLVEPVPLTVAELERSHASEYIAAVRTGDPRELAESNGLTWDPGVWTAACASNGGVVAAVMEAVRTRRNTGSMSSGLHHARAASGAGFCTFNGLALGARAALDAGARRVIIVDLDAHCGGGTVSMVDDFEVVHVDVSVSEFDRYEPRRDRVRLEIVRSADDYLRRIETQLRRLDDLEFDVALYNAGMDPHQASMGGLGGITFSVLAERERILFDWAMGRGLPVAFVLAGGYVSDALTQEDLVGLHRLTVASAALANSGQAMEVHRMMNDGYAGPHRGTEGFAFDPNGRKVDGGFHAELLGDEDTDSFAYDLDDYLELTPENQERFHRERHGYPGRHSDFLRMLLDGQR
jgi:acetoin utilization deacetylase AcuC-like enzyme